MALSTSAPLATCRCGTPFVRSRWHLVHGSMQCDACLHAYWRSYRARRNRLRLDAARQTLLRMPTAARALIAVSDGGMLVSRAARATLLHLRLIQPTGRRHRTVMATSHGRAVAAILRAELEVDR
jgi:hypothetical protein